MPLINCHECGEAVSDHARTCPKCGAPVIATIKRGQKRMLLQLGISLIFFVVAMFFVWKIV
ncbi:MAG: zinc ribbon domain-containing protein [Verrucomicrobiota bacterium]